MRKETIALLEKYEAYPSEKRNALELEDLIKLTEFFESELKTARVEAEERYKETYIWDETRVMSLQEGLKYLSKHCKEKELQTRTKIGKHFCGPMPK